jgi:hypothetical protein
MMGIPFLVRKLPAAVLAEATARADRTLGRFGRGAAGAR